MSAKRSGKKAPKKASVDPAAAAAKRERRAQAKVLREDQARKARRKRMLTQVGIVAAVAVVAVGVTVALMVGRTPDPVASPPGFDKDGGITVGNADAPVTVTMVEDFACPHCAAAHEETKDLFEGYAAGDDVRVDYRPIALLDLGSSDDYSTRALNAAVCVVQERPESWPAIHDSLMENQPDEGSGLSDDQLDDLAAQAVNADAKTGTTTTTTTNTDRITDCIADRPHDDWIEYTTHRASHEDDFGGTPTAYVDGNKVDASPDAIDAAVEDALAK